MLLVQVTVACSEWTTRFPELLWTTKGCLFAALSMGTVWRQGIFASFQCITIFMILGGSSDFCTESTLDRELLN